MSTRFRRPFTALPRAFAPFPPTPSGSQLCNALPSGRPDMAGTAATATYPSRVVEKETRHTLSLLEPQLSGCGSFLDVGCGAGYVARDLAGHFPGEIATVDFRDCRAAETPGFTTFDG